MGQCKKDATLLKMRFLIYIVAYIYICMFSIIYWQWFGVGSWNPSSWRKTKDSFTIQDCWWHWQHKTTQVVHGANMGPTWVLSAHDGPHVGPMNLATRDKVNRDIIDLVLPTYFDFSTKWLMMRMYFYGSNHESNSHHPNQSGPDWFMYMSPVWKICKLLFTYIYIYFNLDTAVHRNP